MKANYPVEYMTALMTAELHSAAGPIRELKMAQTLEESKRLKINVLIPDINKSLYNFSIEGRSIRFGLSAIKNVGSAAINAIIDARTNGGPFTSFRDMLFRIDLRKANKKTIESLIKAGALDSFGNRATLLAYYPQCVKEIVAHKEQMISGQFGLFGDQNATTYKSDNYTELPELSDDKLAEFEKEVIGFLLSHNPMDRHHDLICAKVTKHIADIGEGDENRTFIFAGNVTQMKIVKTKKKNDNMAFIRVNDNTGSAEVVVFPKTYEANKPDLIPNTVVLFKGKISERDGEYSILLEKIVNLDKKRI